MPRRSVLLLCVALVSSAPVTASALVIDFAGDVTAVVDGDARLDGSISPGTRLTGRYQVDPTPTGAPGEVSSARLTFALGDYTFDVAQAPHRIELLDDFPVATAQIDRWLPAAFVAGQLDPAIPTEPGHAGYSARIEFTDGTHTLITGLEPAPFVVLDATPWSDTRVIFSSLIAAPGGATDLGSLQWEVEIDTWSVVPEPASGALLGLGLVALARARRWSS